MNTTGNRSTSMIIALLCNKLGLTITSVKTAFENRSNASISEMQLANSLFEQLQNGWSSVLDSYETLDVDGGYANTSISSPIESGKHELILNLGIYFYFCNIYYLVQMAMKKTWRLML